MLSGTCHLALNQRHNVCCRAVDGEARGQCVPTTTANMCDPSDINLGLSASKRALVQLALARAWRPDERRHLDTLNRTKEVDHSLGVGLPRARCVEIGNRHVCDGETAVQS